MDLLVYGDGGEFSKRIITPIVQFLAFEVDKKGGSGKEPVLRITYDDANESFVDAANFNNIISKTGVKCAAHSLWLLDCAADHAALLLCVDPCVTYTG